MSRLFLSHQPLHDRYQRGDLAAAFDVSLRSHESGDAIDVCCGLLETFSTQIADAARLSSPVTLDVSAEVLTAFVDAMYGKGLKDWFISLAVPKHAPSLMALYTFGHTYEILGVDEAVAQLLSSDDAIIADRIGVRSQPEMDMIANLYQIIPPESESLHDVVFERLLDGRDVMSRIQHELHARHFDRWAETLLKHSKTAGIAELLTLYDDILLGFMSVMKSQVRPCDWKVMLWMGPCTGLTLSG